MNVTVSADWSSGEGTRRGYAVTLDEQDLVSFGKDTSGWSPKKVFDELTRTAEIMVVSHVAKQKGMSSEYAQQRVRQLSES